MSRILFTRLDWLIAWRHLRTGEELPVWVRPLLLGALYLIAVGAAMAWHASQLDVSGGVEGPFGPIEDEFGPTPLQRYYGVFGGFTLIIGVMALTFGLLAWFFNLLPTIITMSVLLGCMALVVVLSLMSGLEGDLRDKILNQKAHIRVSTADSLPFGDYEALADAIGQAEGIAGASPYLEGEIMVRSGLNRQGAILAGIIPERQTEVSNLPDLIKEGDYAYLDNPDAIPEPDPFALIDEDSTPWRLRHLDKERKKANDADPDDDDPPKVPSKLPQPAPDETDETDDEHTGDGGAWEDPAQELRRLKIKGSIALPATPEPIDDDDQEWEDPAQELARLKALPPPPPLDEDDGWEDPAEEVPRLREQGKLPPAPEGSAEPDAGAQDDGDEPDTDEDDGEEDATVIKRPILIGRELSMELAVRVGADVQLITPVGRTTPAGQIPGIVAAKVGGVFFSGMYEYDRKNVYAPLPMVQRFLLTGDRVSGIEVKLEDLEAIDDGKAIVEAVVAEVGRGDELVVEDWRDLNRNLFSAMFLEKVAMFIALLFVVLVASFGILASNLMSVMEKAKEIAILKAMGASDQGIMRVFIAEGLCVGILGSFGGIGMGLGLCWALDRYGLPLNENVYYIEKLPVVVNPAEVALVGVAALIIVCISSLYPALVASRLRPVDALRQADQ